MSKFDWRNGFALGLIAGLSLAILVFLYGEGLYDLGNCVADAKHCQGPEGHKDTYEPEWRYWTRRLIAAEDTLAQWIMAFFTIFATVILMLTLRSANMTNKAAVEASRAATEANRIMREERRPWLWVRDFEITKLDIWEIDGDPIIVGNWKYNIVNTGAHAAVHFAPNEIMFIEREDVREIVIAEESAQSKRDRRDGWSVAPGATFSVDGGLSREIPAPDEGVSHTIDLEVVIVITYFFEGSENPLQTTQSFRIFEWPAGPGSRASLDFNRIRDGTCEPVVEALGRHRMT